ncbi:undecaprenyl diphosphate synthase family protein [Pollutimonas sp. M17]|uniref:undecaprenyl diphosphate synthase family protein n=1 Tax=Pollutimonas sp. M17 TaxID=2962065 RepID=UPI0021F45972|nr:undecaprenyl diphosphate synthase family protein [Pollutimonas sp. M17]UYO94159.1 undecaprenyl diphosphate synthase family protein [Pollutimonas sp. M17]
MMTPDDVQYGWEYAAAIHVPLCALGSTGHGHGKYRINADIFVVDAYWPDFKPDHLYEALSWFERQDRTLGG